MTNSKSHALSIDIDDLLTLDNLDLL